MRWDDVDLAAGTVRVSGALRGEPKPEGGVVVRRGDTKTPQSLRVLRLPKWAVEILIEHQAHALGLDPGREALADAGLWVDEGLVFPSDRAHGGLYESGTYRKAVTAAAAAAGIPDITPNELRHTHASVLLDDGVSLHETADRLGHRNSRVTESTYKHCLTPVVDAGVESIASIG